MAGKRVKKTNLILLIHFESLEMWCLLPFGSFKIALIKQADYTTVFLFVRSLCTVIKPRFSSLM